MKPTPYNTGKIKIGCDYFPQIKPQTMSTGEQMIQRALLDGEPVESKKYDSTYWIVIGLIALAYWLGLFGDMPGVM